MSEDTPRRAPSCLDERVVLRVEDVAYGGSGVGRHEGIVYFVPEVIPGELVEVEVVRNKKKFREARLVRVVESSPERVSARCPVFGRCGGCAYQHMTYAEQLVWKRKQVTDLYRRVGGIGDAPVFPVIPSPEEWNYRNRIRIHVREGRVGFFERGGHRVVETSECVIASRTVNARLRELRKAPGRDRELTLAERPEVSYFEQTNDSAAAVLCALLEEHLPGEASVLVDAYAGAGFFGRRLAHRFESVVGIESHSGAVVAARRNASVKETYHVGSVEDLLPKVLQEARGRGVLVLLDPPAEGLASEVIPVLGAERPRFVMYVSCDPATQARDVRRLVGEGYRLKWLRPLDMFPHTADIEVVAMLDAGG